VLTRGCREQRIEKLAGLYLLPSAAGRVIERIMGWQGYGRCGRELRVQFLWGNMKEVSHFRDLDVDGRMINMDLREMAGDVAGVRTLGI
jgi:hypothetical protein